MIVLRERSFSKFLDINRITTRLDKDKEENYELTDQITDDTTCINIDLDNIKIYIPLDLEFTQYEIDDFIRSMIPSARTHTEDNRDVYLMEVKHSLTEDQYYRLVKFIIKNNEFCSIINNKNI